MALPLLIDGTPRAAALARAEQALELVNVVQRASSLPCEMSGGEQQRVGIARALVINPAVILADEPTGALNRATGKHILAELHACSKRGQTVVVVTHDLGRSRPLQIGVLPCETAVSLAPREMSRHRNRCER